MSDPSRDDPPYPWVKVIAMSALMFGGVGLLIYRGCTEQSEIRGDGHAYFQALREGRIDDAYNLLSTQTKQQVSREMFETSLYTPKLRRATDATFNWGSVSSTGNGCLIGGIGIDGRGESFYALMVQEGESWRVRDITFEAVIRDRKWHWCHQD